ncbi:MAG: hypothetical protein Q9159_006946 [Coniocarpon cinnabarinum]
MVAEGIRTAAEAPQGSTTAARASLYVAMAYANGFGVDKNTKEFIVWLKKGAENGSGAAQSMLKICEHPSESSDLILNETRSRCVETKPSPCTACLVPAQPFASKPDLDSATPGSKSVEHGCNVLRYLTTYCQPAVADSQDQLSQPREYLSHSKESAQRRAVMTRLVEENIGYIYSSAARPHVISMDFPLSLAGSPLAFATTLRDTLAMDIILAAGASPLDGVARYCRDGCSALEFAVAGLLLAEFDILWQNCMSRYGKEGLRAYLMEDHCRIPSLVASTAHKSVAERIVLHGLAWQTHRHAMLERILRCFAELDMFDETFHTPIMPLLYKSISHILALGDVETGLDLLVQINGREPRLRILPEDSQRLRDHAIDLACEGLFGISESAEYLRFARLVDPTRNTVAQICRSLVTRKSKALLLQQLEIGSAVDAVDQNGETLIHYMIGDAFLDPFLFQHVLCHSKTTDHRDNNGVTPLHLAATHGQASAVKQLLISGANVLVKDKAGHTVLHKAVRSLHGPTVRLVLEALFHLTSDLPVEDVNVHKTEETGALSPISRNQCLSLHTAAKEGSPEIVKVLLSYGAEVKKLDNDHNMPIHRAFDSSCGNIEAVISCAELLRAAGSPLHCRNKFGETALHVAVRRWREHELVRIFDSLGEDLMAHMDASDFEGRTILHNVSSSGDEVAVSALLGRGASCHVYDVCGRTPLQACVQASPIGGRKLLKKHMRTVELLIDKSAWILWEDMKGHNALDYAVSGAKTRIATFFVQHIYGKANDPASHVHRSRRDLIMDAWHTAIAYRHWAIVIPFLLHADHADLDLGALRWPVGAQLLKEVVDSGNEQLQSLFSISHLERMNASFLRTEDPRTRKGATTLLSARSRPNSQDRPFHKPWKEIVRAAVHYQVHECRSVEWDSYEQTVFEGRIDPQRLHDWYDKHPILHQRKVPQLIEVADFFACLPPPVLQAYFGSDRLGPLGRIIHCSAWCDTISRF